MGKILTVFAVAAVLSTGCISEKKGADMVKAGDPVPAFTVTNSTEEGSRTFTRADFVGKRSMIIFFATWCPDCRRELPVIHEAWRRLSERDDFMFVAISREESAEAVSAYWNSETETKPPFDPMPWWLDPDRSAFLKFADSTIPRIYLVDTSGRIAMTAVETFDLTADKIVELIEELK